MQIIFTIQEEKLQDVVDAMAYRYPIPTTDGSPDFTEEQWAKEALRRIVVDVVHQYKRTVASQAAHAALSKDDGIIS